MTQGKVYGLLAVTQGEVCGLLAVTQVRFMDH